MLLKYFLLEFQREAIHEEILRLVLTDNDLKSNAIRVQLRRLRTMLSPLIPEGAPGLITFKVGNYGIYPGYRLRFDTVTFVLLLKQIENIPLHDPGGLTLCSPVPEIQIRWKSLLD